MDGRSVDASTSGVRFLSEYHKYLQMLSFPRFWWSCERRQVSCRCQDRHPVDLAHGDRRNREAASREAT
jgi:hypothetical protein